MPTRVQVTLKTVDNVSENFVTNQFCTSSFIELGTDSTAAVAAFKAFYDAINSDLLPETIARDGHIIKLYELPGLTPNYPYLETTFNLTATPTGVPLPSEVALCLSFQGPRAAGFPQARRRGRIFLGPLEAGVNSAGRPAAGDITVVLAAAQNLFDAIDAIPSAGEWSVWSPTDGEAVPLVEAWVDNAFDTQRSRGLDRTTKTVQSLV